MNQSNSKKIKIFADGANMAHILGLASNPAISGFTTNPTLMKAAGVTDYAGFAKELLSKITDKPISFEVFADDLAGMHKQALQIASWGKNVNVKIPVTNTLGESTVPILGPLSKEGVKLNVTALFTLDQVKKVHEALNPSVYAILSVFAGRIADTGRDAEKVIADCRAYLGNAQNTDLLWASSREVYNLVQAENSGADIITMSPSLLDKIPMFGKDLVELSLDTVKMFRRDAEAAGFKI